VKYSNSAYNYIEGFKKVLFYFFVQITSLAKLLQAQTKTLNMNTSTTGPYSCVILDDEPLITKIIERYISNMENLELKGIFTDPIDAMAAFKEFERVDFLFLDIEMDVSGFDVARMLRNSVRFIIYISSHSTYAINDLLNADRLLVKPVVFRAFHDTVNDLISGEGKH
jgi:two-component system LytT family response regulator